jgi:hypothetical protein
MFFMKLLRWLAKLAVSSALICGFSLFSAWYVVNLYVEQLMKQFQIADIGKRVQFSDVLARLTEELNIVKPKADESKNRLDQPAASTVVQGSSPNGGEGNQPAGERQSQDGSRPDGKSSNTEEKVPEDAVAVWSRTSNNAGSGTNTDKSVNSSSNSSTKGSNSGVESGGLNDMVLTMQDFVKKKEAISSQDKMKIFSILTSKLPPAELQKISGIVEDGITSEELKEVDATLRTYLSQDEYNQLLDIIKKY